MIFVDKIRKYTPCGWFKQDRIIAVTTENIYNIKVDKVQRRIQIANLGGLTKSMTGCKDEVVIHINGEHDYRYSVETRRNELIEAIKQAYADKMHTNLPIFGADKTCLKAFVTGEKDVRRGVNRIPPIQFRMLEEDLIKGESPKTL